MPDMPLALDATESPVPLEQMPRRKHKRGRRSKGKGAQAHHAEAKTHIANAAKATTPTAGLGHLFKAVRSMHAAKQAEPTTDQSTDL